MSFNTALVPIVERTSMKFHPLFIFPTAYTIYIQFLVCKGLKDVDPLIAWDRMLITAVER